MSLLSVRQRAWMIVLCRVLSEPWKRRALACARRRATELCDSRGKDISGWIIAGGERDGIGVARSDHRDRYERNNPSRRMGGRRQRLGRLSGFD